MRNLNQRKVKVLTPRWKKPRVPCCRGVRGATTAIDNSADAILSATRELLYTMIRANDLKPEDVASIYFTTTVDLNATYPAVAARQLGWYDTALICGHEMDVPDSLPRCIRILVHWNTNRRLDEIIHVYLHETAQLRPDRESTPPIGTDELMAALNLVGEPVLVQR